MHGVRELRTLGDALERMRTDLRGYRDRLVTSERQAAWGQMARKIAHEVKNPLTPIAISVSDLRRSYEQQRPDFAAILDQATRTISEELETLKTMLQEFSDFGRMAPPRFAPCDPAMLFADLAALYAGDIAGGRLSIEPPFAGITWMTDAGQMRQALVNLIKNGLEAIAPSGRVKVSAAAEGGWLEIRVSDDGPGLTRDQMERLFVPGFSTKAHGSGLGLTIVERIASDHQGTIRAVSGNPAGTEFRLRVPLVPRN